MVYVVSRWEFAKTTLHARRACPLFRFVSYDRLFGARRLRGGTYIFTDLDRLGPFELEMAGIIARELEAGGSRVMNDPARALTRYDLLRALYRAGINRFDVCRPQFGEWPERYPVFLRRNAFHTGAESELLYDRGALESALEEVLGWGIPKANLMAVEYAAEASGNGVFRKYSVYRIGERYFQDTTVNQRDWQVKSGETGVAGEAFYEEELASFREVPFEATVKRAFALAEIEYGRVDIGLSGGEPQVYEINTNPRMSFRVEHPSPARRESRRIFKESYSAAIAELNARADGPPVRLRSPLLKKKRRNFRWFLRLRSRPSI